MKCPNCQTKNLKNTLFFNVGIDYCPTCFGIWFEKDKLRQAKDKASDDLRWLDIDLWQDKNKFKVSKTQKACPKDNVPLYEVAYNDSDIKVDVCDMCHGVWLDQGEFKKIVEYLKNKGNEEILYNYAQSLLSEAREVFTGPEGLSEEMKDVWLVLHLLNYKFLVHHQTIAKIISVLAV